MTNYFLKALILTLIIHSRIYSFRAVVKAHASNDFILFMTKQKQNCSYIQKDLIEKGDAANKQHVGHLPEWKSKEKRRKQFIIIEGGLNEASEKNSLNPNSAWEGTQCAPFKLPLKTTTKAVGSSVLSLLLSHKLILVDYIHRFYHLEMKAYKLSYL